MCDQKLVAIHQSYSTNFNEGPVAVVQYFKRSSKIFDLTFSYIVHCKQTSYFFTLQLWYERTQSVVTLILYCTIDSKPFKRFPPKVVNCYQMKGNFN